MRPNDAPQAPPLRDPLLGVRYVTLLLLCCACAGKQVRHDGVPSARGEAPRFVIVEAGQSVRMRRRGL